MAVSLSFDRFEGPEDATAVLAADDGTTFDVPKAWLPEGAQPGDVLTLTFARDAEATTKLAEETRKVQDELKTTDPGGDVKL